MLKRNFLITAILCILAVMFFGVFWYEGRLDLDFSREEEFSCFTYDNRGDVLQGYRSETDGVWYLFLTSTQSVEDTKLYYTGSVSASSAGRLSERWSTVSGAFSKSGDRVELTAPDGSISTVVVMQSDLPSVYIDLEGTTLEEIHANKDTKYPGNSIYIMDPDGSWDLNGQGCLEIKGRGNSSWLEYEKKGYQIKFNKEVSLMGMEPAKKWVLLANAGDDSMMRTQLVSRMAQNLDLDFAASFEYVDLWIEGEYRGTYLIGEKVEIGSYRLNLTNTQGTLFEHDEDFYLGEDNWFYSKLMDKHFVVKESVNEDQTAVESAMADFGAAVDELMAYLYATPSEEVTLEELSVMIDVDSFVKYYLINEYALNRESYSTSFYWYQDGPDDVLHLGPVWDFDSCMGNDGEASTSSYGKDHILFRCLLAVPEFYQQTLELWEKYRAELEGMTDDVDVIAEEISASAQMNYVRWDVLGKPNPKGGIEFCATFDEAADTLRSWLQGRESGFEVARCRIITGVVSDDCSELELRFRDDQEYSALTFAVWSLDEGQDDLRWYEAEQGSDGAWRCTVDLSKHNSAGMYRFDAYVAGAAEATALGFNFVETARESRYPLEITLSEDGGMMTVRMTDMDEDLTAARFAVWGANAGQATIQWLDAEREGDGLWTVSIPLCSFQVEGGETFLIHAYGTEAEEEEFLNNGELYVGSAARHVYTDGVCGLCGAME